MDFLLRRTPAPRPIELVVVALLLLLVGVAVYGAYVLHGGFYLDDWSNSAGYQFAHSPRFWSTVSELHGELGGRPLLALFLPVPDALFGAHPAPQLGLALGLGIATSLCLFLALRTLSLAPLHAGAIAVLALLFPWSDSIRLWATASVNSVSVCLFLLGLVVALRGLKRGGRAGIAQHACADALYLLSVLTYEVAAAAALLAGFLYLGRAPLARVRRFWLADIIVVLAALVYSLATTVTARHVGSLGERVGDIAEFVRESALLLVSSLVPLGSPGRLVQALVLLFVAAIVVLSLARARRSSEQALRGWIGWALLGLIALAAAYFMFLGSHLHPRDPGIDNRINVFAGLAWSILVYAIVAMASNLLIRSSRLAAVVAALVALVIAVGYGFRVGDDASAWRRASALQHQVLAAVDRQLPPLPRASTLLTFGHRSQAAPEVPVFNKPDDLRGALELQAGDSSLRAYPVTQGVRVRCGRDRLLVEGPLTYGTFRVRYGRLFFLEVHLAEGRRVRSAAQCRQALAGFRRRGLGVVG